MELTTAELDYFDEQGGLKGYTKSPYFVIGIRLLASGRIDEAIDSFKRGADNNSCVGGMSFYSQGQNKRNNFHLTIPLALESAIRGHILSINMLISCYKETKPVPVYGLMSFWMKLTNEYKDFELDSTAVVTDKQSEVVLPKKYDPITEIERNNQKKDLLNHCFMCSKKDSKERTFHKCGICKQYSYCGKDCQSYGGMSTVHDFEGVFEATLRHRNS